MQSPINSHLTTERVRDSKLHQQRCDVTRPDDLPDFDAPPLDEVVFGIQFKPPQNYSQIFAGEVWSLYKDGFPRLEEHSALQPAFETFGLPGGGQIGLNLLTGATHDRFWFLSDLGDELIQFQNDRLLHNWRKVGDRSNVYPRFERMMESFRNEVGAFETYISTLANQSLSINQCEISYINLIIPEADTDASGPDEWLRISQFDAFEPDDFTMTLRKAIRDTDGNPFARLICEAQSVFEKRTSKAGIKLSLMVRGAPRGTDIEAAFRFLEKGRQVIVETFAAITTDSAHTIWKRRQ